MRKKKLIALVLALCLCLGALSGCSGAGGGGNTLTWQIVSDITALDPAFSYDGPTMSVMLQVSEGLLALNTDGSIKPLLAKSWEQTDEVTYVYQVRDDVTFSDGSAMTMDDVLYSLERYRDPEVASYLSWMYENVASIEQTSDWELTVKLMEADACFQYVFATAAGNIVKKDYCEEKGEDFGKPAGSIVATGPYKVESWQVGSSVTLVKNENYWDENYQDLRVDKIVYNVISEDTTRVSALTSGQSDVDLMVPAALYEEVEASDKVWIDSKPSNNTVFLSMNCEKEPFTDVNVRRAIASAIDKASLSSVIGHGGQAAGALPMSESLYTFDRESWQAFAAEHTGYAYDLEQAKAYLADSEFSEGFTVSLLVDEQAMNNAIALAIQQSLVQIGITVEIEKVSQDELIAVEFGEVMDGGIRGYDMGLFEWESDWPDPSGNTMGIFNSMYIGEGGTNFPSYSNEEVDGYLNAQAVSSDPAERTKLLQQALEIIIDEVPVIPMVYSDYNVALSKEIKAFDFITWASFVKDIQWAE